jgi:hypothetical protein
MYLREMGTVRLLCAGEIAIAKRIRPAAGDVAGLCSPLAFRPSSSGTTNSTRKDLPFGIMI